MVKNTKMDAGMRGIEGCCCGLNMSDLARGHRIRILGFEELSVLDVEKNNAPIASTLDMLQNVNIF